MSDPRLCLALDGAAAVAPLDWIARTKSVFGVYKIGLELFCAHGPKIVGLCREAGARQVFLDLKLHDIPQTVARAIRALRSLDVDYLTVHLAGGRAMLDAAQAEAGTTSLLGITVLTSLAEHDLQAAGLLPLQTALARRAALAQAAGLTGVVCSPLEASRVRDMGLAPVTPGIRWSGAPADDQSRVSDPATALAAGAELLVIGRMITASANLKTDLERVRVACR